MKAPKGIDMSDTQGKNMTMRVGGRLEELLVAADELFQEEFYDRAGVIDGVSFAALMKTLGEWQKLSQALLAAVENR